MPDKQVKIPGPDHPITVEPNPGRVAVTFAGRVIADTTSAWTLQESTYPAVQYIPRSDVDPAVLEPSDHRTYCPYKGDAGYFSLRVDDRRAQDAVWTYEAPYDAVSPIKSHLAFYPDRVDAIEQAPLIR
jgi:uncharacterized protein (DUF427 family)